MALIVSIERMIFTVVVLACLFISTPAFAQLSQEPEFSSPAQKENWVEWNLLSTLKNTLLPAYITPQTEEQVQHWLGEVHKFNSEFSEANQHVLNMDRATRAHDVDTTNAEAKAAAAILNQIPWKPYLEGDVFNDTSTTGNDSTPSGNDSVPSDGTLVPPPSGGGSGTPSPGGGPAIPGIVQKGSTASNAHLNNVQNAIGGLPKNVQQFMRNHNVKVIATDTLVDERPAEKAVQPRGWQSGLTWSNSEAGYDKDNNQVIVGDRYTVKGKLVHGNRVGSVAVHESGHAVDHNMGDYSHNNPQYVSAYSKEKGSLLSAANHHDPAGSAAATSLRYFLQSGNTGREEMFSESFASIYGGASSGAANQHLIETYFPNTLKVVRNAMTSLH